MVGRLSVDCCPLQGEIFGFLYDDSLTKFVNNFKWELRSMSALSGQYSEFSTGGTILPEL
jgi:hypothetical protein